jgi:hypothetical protein
MREASAPEEGHELEGLGVSMLVERFERAFPTDGILQQDNDKIQRVIVPEA